MGPPHLHPLAMLKSQEYIHLSCRPFALNDLDDYEKHFTVMNYDPGVALKQVRAGGGP